MRILFFLTLFVLTVPVFAQKQEQSPFLKFGKVTAAHLQNKIYSIDSNANAVVLSDIGETAIEGNSKGWFSLVFSRHRVVHILNKSAYDLATVELSLYSDGQDEEKLESVKAVTYNLENGKVIETKMEKSAVFREKQNQYWSSRKFTLPNVKEGCIIEYEYKVTSDYYWNVRPWAFQNIYAPVLWSELIFTVPKFFSYTFLSNGYHPLYINDRKDYQQNFTVRDATGTQASTSANFTESVTDYRWVMKDVPELKKESFTSTLSNHISKIEFQFTSRNYPLTPRDYRTTWPGLTKELLEADYFGKALSKENNWMSDDIKTVSFNATDDLDKVKKIFSFVRDNFSCTDHSAKLTDQSLKSVMKTRKGTVAEINLLLTAMLKRAGFQADPVILSTTDNGYIYEYYPLLDRFNYVVTQLIVGDKKYYLDASYRELGFGILLPECYNGQARVVNEQATPLMFVADSLKERKLTSVFINNTNDGKWTGAIKQAPGYFESVHIRSKLKQKGKEEFFKEVQKSFDADVTISDPQIEDSANLDKPLGLSYQFDMNLNNDDILYINPLFGERYKKNPFTSATRAYPVEMPYASDETIILTMDIPTGYEVDELPKQVVAKLDEEGKSFFEYRISHSGNVISMRCRVKMDRALFAAEEYEVLREFFNMIVSKQSEQIVLKKKK